MIWAPVFAGALALAGCATVPAPDEAQARQAQAPVPELLSSKLPVPPAAMQWLYGSGEAGALSIQAYHAMRDFVLAQAKSGRPQGVVLAEGSTLDAPQFKTCRPEERLAVILDVDETALLNLGYEYDEAVKERSYDAGRWGRWEQTGADKVAPVPGAITALRAIRAAGVTVIFNSNRQAANAAQTAAAIEGAGLGPAKHGETLFLKGDVVSGSAKDPRRALVASRYCVVAMAGDQLGDFSDFFNERDLRIPQRRAAATNGTFASLWGNGWFLLPNPVYGPGVRGTFDDVFPADKRWSDPAGEK